MFIMFTKGQNGWKKGEVIEISNSFKNPYFDTVEVEGRWITEYCCLPDEVIYKKGKYKVLGKYYNKDGTIEYSLKDEKSFFNINITDCKPVSIGKD